jgi:hypothetical protein
MNIAGNTALHQLVAQAVRKLPVDTTNDAFSNISNTAANASTLTSGIAPVTSSSSDSSQQDSTYDESFAKLLVQLKSGAAAFESSVDSNLAAAQGASDNADTTTGITSTGDTVAGTDDGAVAADSNTSHSATLKDFLAYMNESPAEKLRDKMTGVSKSEYDSMTPDQQAAIDKKVQDSLKQQQETATADVNAKILAARLALV